MKRIIALFMITALCLLSACTALKESQQNKPGSSSLELSESDPYIVVPEAIPLNGFTDYQSTIEEYRRFAGYAIEFNEEYYKNVPESELWYNQGFMGGLVALANTSNKTPFTKKDYGYAIKDLNGNGSPELILLLQDYTIFAIFSTLEGKPKLLDDYWPRHYCAIDDKGLIYTRGSGGAGIWEYSVQQISQNDNELLLIEGFGNNAGANGDNYFKIVNGEESEISTAEYNQLEEKYSKFINGNPKEITKNSGLKFIPLFD